MVDLSGKGFVCGKILSLLESHGDLSWPWKHAAIRLHDGDQSKSPSGQAGPLLHVQMARQGFHARMPAKDRPKNNFLTSCDVWRAL
ncbi:MAG: hypothetical protein ABSH20_30140 [Tepidisphaeraceae bacterium]